MWLIPISLLILFEAIADVFSKEYSLNGRAWEWGIAIASYLVANVFWLFAIRRGSGLARGAVIFSIGSALVAVIIGLLIYKEKVSQMQIAGFATGLLAIVLLTLSET